MEDANGTVLKLEDGEYIVETVLEGGSGRAEVTSPAEMYVENGQAYVRIEWSSSHYDYMKIDGKQYDPVNEDGNSVFEIPVEEFDRPIEVSADTTAMSRPHEVEYTLTFASESVTPVNSGEIAVLVLAAALFFAAGCVIWKKRRKRKCGQD